jgi:soluble lytic murein transglycosylase
VNSRQAGDSDPAPHKTTLSLLRRALSEQNYLDARSLLEASDLPELSTRDWVTGHVEFALGEYDAALEHLDLARTRWPALSKLLEPIRREAWLRSASPLGALAELERSRDADEMLLVASRLLDAGEPGKAARLTRRAASFSGNSQRKQAEVRALRAQVSLALDQPYGALMDWRWLAVNAPLQPAAAGADELISQYFPRTPLKPEQRFLRARKFAGDGRVAETDRELELLQAAPNYKIRKGEVLHLQGWARYRARDYASAAEWLLDAANNGSYQALSDMYHAARALSRAGRVHEAISVFEKVSKSTPAGQTTRSARFRIGAEWLVLGEWQRAADAHTEFLNNFIRSEHQEAAERERAVAWFALGKYAEAATGFRKLRALDLRGNDAGLYQLLEAVSREHAGHAETASALLKDLALGAPLSFAGQQAARRLASLNQTPDGLGTLAPPTTTRLPPLPAPVVELEQLGLYELAEEAMTRAESTWLPDGDTSRTQTRCDAYGSLSAGRRRYLIGIDGASRSGFWNRPFDAERWLWNCVYPTPYPETVTAAARRWEITPALVYSVMRQESAFHSSIESPAKARGLMQIIPPTAHRIGEEIGLRTFPGLLDAPAYNIRYGAFYLKKLLDAFDGHPAPAIAAYNAGPGAAKRWRHATRDLPVELFIARIPFTETRRYVQRVLGNLFIYQMLYPEYGALSVPVMLSSTTGDENPATSTNVTIDPELY